MTDSGAVLNAAGWLDRFFDHYHRSNPVSATFLGEHAWPGRLPDYSASGIEAADDRIVALLSEAAAIDRESLATHEGHDLRLAVGALRIQQWELQSWHVHRGNPSLYTGEAAFGLISLFLTDYAPLAERVEAARERLEGIPRLFEQARLHLDAAPLAWTERAIRECDGLAALLDDGLRQLDGGRVLATPGFAVAVARAASAVGGFRAFLEKDLRSRPTDRVAAGDEALALLLSEGHLLDEDSAEVERYARAELAEVEADLDAQASEFGSSLPAEVLEQLKNHRPSEEAYEGEYQRVWEEARRVSDEAGLVSWPDAPIRYVERPPWVRAAAPYLYFLFYRSPSPVGRPPVHDYLISPFDRSASPEARRHFLEAHNDSVIKLNHVIHHGGLGHHVQNSRAFQSGSRVGRMAAVDCASRIALMCGGTVAEGWACYATDLMGEAGFLTPLEQFAERQGRARMCARAIVDVSIHQGRWSLEQAARFYEEHALMSPSAAMGEAVKNSMFPGAAVMYLMGRDAIHCLRSEMRALEGDRFSLRRFHDTFLSYGSIPVSLIAEAMKRSAIADR